MTRIVDGPPYETLAQLAAALGVTERTVRRWIKHPDPMKRLKVGYDPHGRVFAYREWVRDWAKRNSRTNDTL